MGVTVKIVKFGVSKLFGPPLTTLYLSEPNEYDIRVLRQKLPQTAFQEKKLFFAKTELVRFSRKVTLKKNSNQVTGQIFSCFHHDRQENSAV